MNILKFENRLNQATEYTKIKLCIDNLVATFGEDIVKAVVMSDLSLSDKDIGLSAVLTDVDVIDFTNNKGRINE